MPIEVSSGKFILAFVHFHINLQTCIKFGRGRSSGLEVVLDVCIFQPLNPSHNAPWVVVGLIVLGICIIKTIDKQKYSYILGHNYLTKTSPPGGTGASSIHLSFHWIHCNGQIRTMTSSNILQPTH